MNSDIIGKTKEKEALSSALEEKQNYFYNFFNK